MDKFAHLSRRARPPCREPRGFSLVEVLVVLAIMMVLAAMVISASTVATDTAGLTGCRANLRQVGLAALAYAKDHGGALPVTTTLDGPQQALTTALAEGRYLQEPRTYYCPAERNPLRQFSDDNFAQGKIGYFYFSCEKTPDNRFLSAFLRWEVAWPRRLVTGMPAATWVMSDCWFSGEPTSHRAYKKGVNYLRIDGSVGTVEESPRETFR